MDFGQLSKLFVSVELRMLLMVLILVSEKSQRLVPVQVVRVFIEFVDSQQSNVVVVVVVDTVNVRAAD
jgi:hypothetical protein